MIEAIEIILNVLAQIFGAYYITLALTKGNALYKVREWFKEWTPALKINGKHGIDCRLCTGFYVSIVVWYLFGMTTNIFLIWGASYFLVTQERT